jgi:hypothetical protein
MLAAHRLVTYTPATVFRAAQICTDECQVQHQQRGEQSHDASRDHD